MKNKTDKIIFNKIILLLFGVTLVFSNVKGFSQIKDSEIYEEAESLEKELDDEADVFEEESEFEEEVSENEEDADAEESDEDFSEEKQAENEEENFEEEEAEEELEEEPAQAEEALEEEEGAEEELEEGDEIAVEKGEEKLEEPEVAEELLPESVPDNLNSTVVADEEEELVGDEGPDLEYEAKLYSIFKDYYSEPISDQKWKEVLNQRDVEAYNIVSGDNLWNISQIIFGDGSYWPKVWALNSKITNPHLIEPNNKINFILGNEDNPPSFSISEKQNEKTKPTVKLQKLANSSDPSDDVSEFDSDVEIPPPSKTYNPPLKNLPPSIPQWQLVGVDDGNYNINGMSGANRADLLAQQKKYLTHYILDVKPQFVGKIVEIEENDSMAANNQHVYISATQGRHKPGDKLLIFKSLGTVKASNKFVEKIPADMGYVIEVQGEVELLDYMSSTDEKIDLFRAKTTKIIYPVQLGSLVVSDSIKKISFISQGESSEAVAQIIGGSQSVRRNLYGFGELVFLNRGTAEGFAKGQVLTVRSNRKLRYEKTIIKEDVREIAKIKIVKSGQHFSTALVVEAKEHIYSGDFTGRGSFEIRKDLSASNISAIGPGTQEVSDLEEDVGDTEEEDLVEDEPGENSQKQSLIEEVDNFEEEEDGEAVEEAADDFSDDGDDIDSFLE